MTDVAPRSAYAFDPKTMTPPTTTVASHAQSVTPAVVPERPRGVLKSDIVVVGGTLACVAGAGALATWLPSEITLAGSAILAAAAAGIAAARVFTSRSPQGPSLAALVGMAGIAAITALGSVGMVNHAKNETLAARAVLVEQAQATAGERTALISERGALTAERQALQAERGQLNAGRQQLQAARETFNGEMVAARTALAAEKSELDKRVSEAAEKLAAPEREALTASRAALDAERAVQVDARLAAIAVEAKALSTKQLAEIAQIAEVYQNSGGGRSVRFVAGPWAGNQTTTAAERFVAPDRLVQTLVSKGMVFAGPVSISGDNNWIVTKEAGTAIRSIAELVEFLRLTTNKTISSS